VDDTIIEKITPYSLGWETIAIAIYLVNARSQAQRIGGIHNAIMAIEFSVGGNGLGTQMPVRFPPGLGLEHAGRLLLSKR
jgi:hypothetical protein